MARRGAPSFHAAPEWSRVDHATRRRRRSAACAGREPRGMLCLQGRCGAGRIDRPPLGPTHGLLLAQRMIQFGPSTHVGLRREHNEDTYYADADLGLWLVADGMGGHEHGEVASALARDTVVHEVKEGAPLAQAVQRADEEIIQHSS